MIAVHRSVLALALLSTIAATDAASGKTLGKPPAELGNWQEWVEIPAASFYEVSASRATQAAEWLGNADFLVLKKEWDMNVYFSPVDAACVAPKSLVLLRANYINGATGSFHLSWAGDSIIVMHAFLGPGTQVHETALIACLSKIPNTIYGVTSGAI